METVRPALNFLAALALAPLLPGVINRVKAFFGGRRGQPLLQLYYDLFKLARKTPVYSRTTTWVFRASPAAGLAALLAAAAALPFAGGRPLFGFEGDLVLVVYLLGLARFLTVLAALDTGSAFEGMGASREMQFAVFAEPALFLCLAALARITGSLSFSGVFAALAGDTWRAAVPVLALLTASLFIVLLAENSRVPADDPNTHLELTMIHEVMVLDHSGPDLACILYGASLKLWLFSSLIAGMLLPRAGGGPYECALFVGLVLGMAVAVGVTESAMARLRLLKVPYMLITAFAFAALALIFQLGR
ncbi:MAG: NADH-quinone oxidoreductase subunit H [Elusimicrobia bacterium]|nr:NADH-quinone oxidoreductase subunit H [Elusimicrobiota bacterium]